MMRFEWGEEKNEANLKKHGLVFPEAKTIWMDFHSLEYFDVLHSVDEERFVRIGHTPEGKLLTVVFTERTDHIRLISARPATAAERRKYEERV